jgi:hypothetical protein
MNKPYDEHKMLDELIEIHQTVRRLDGLAEGIRDSVAKGSLWRLIALASALGLAFFPVIPTAALNLTGLNSIIASGSLISIYQLIHEELGKMRALQKEDFYLFWKINHPGNLITFRALLRCYEDEILSKLKDVGLAPKDQN